MIIDFLRSLRITSNQGPFSMKLSNQSKAQIPSGQQTASRAMARSGPQSSAQHYAIHDILCPAHHRKNKAPAVPDTSARAPRAPSDIFSGCFSASRGEPSVAPGKPGGNTPLTGGKYVMFGAYGST
jgi:hypothetical protein